MIEHISQSISSVTDSVTELFDSNRHQSEYITSAAGYFDLIEKNTASITSGMSELKQGVDAVSDSNSQIIQSIENVSALTQEVTASAGATLAGCRTNLQSVDDIAPVSYTHLYGKLVADAEIHLDCVAHGVQAAVSCRLNRAALLVVLDHQA